VLPVGGLRSSAVRALEESPRGILWLNSHVPPPVQVILHHIDRPCFPYSCINGCVGCHHLLATVNSATLDMAVQMFLQGPALGSFQ
jgi:hypothetical protein